MVVLTKNVLEIGCLESKGKSFTLPPDALVQTFAIMGIRGAGKTTTAKVMMEEFSKNSLPWIALDPVGVLWGLRADKNGNSEGGLPVVVFGGPHGDIPIDKDSGQKIAEALIETNVSAIIDLHEESKKTWRKFLTDFCLALMQVSPKDPRHIFVEESAEFAPQRTKVAVTAECKEAVERLVRLGRNKGYGCTLITQRPATVDKDILSQASNLFVMRTVGKHDRKALLEWLEPHFSEHGRDISDGKELVNSLAGLDDGMAYFWSPHWLKTFSKILVRDSHTFHPGETRKVGKAQKSVALMDVREFVAKLRPQLTKKQVVVPATAPATTAYRGLDNIATDQMSGSQKLDLESVRERIERKPTIEIKKDEYAELLRQHEDLRSRLSNASRKAEDALRRLETVRKTLRPQYDALRALFEELGPSNGAAADDSVYEPWLQKAGGGKRRRMLEVVIERKELTRAQLSTLSGTSINSSGFKNSLSWMKVNQLVDVTGERVILRSV